MKVFKIILIVLGSILLLFVLAFGFLFIQWIGLKTPEFKGPDGKTVEKSVAELIRIKIGGINQVLLIRGINTDNPVLLILHGGPGSPEMALFRSHNAELENNFIVVNWDQRGAGKSYSPFISSKTMNIAQFISDSHEVVSYLKKRFDKKKIFIVGHSWGSFLGINLIQKYPEDFYAYVGVGQLVNLVENEKISMKFVLEKAKADNNEKALKQLLPIEKNYPKLTKDSKMELMIQRQWLVYYGGVIKGEKNYNNFFKTTNVKEYNMFDMFLFIAGGLFSLDMWPELLEKSDLINTAPKLEVPVYFFTGAHDYNVPFELTEKYFNILQAPKKELIWFENSAHMPPFEEAQKFNKLMVEKILKDNYNE